MDVDARPPAPGAVETGWQEGEARAQLLRQGSALTQQSQTSTARVGEAAGARTIRTLGGARQTSSAQTGAV